MEIGSSKIGDERFKYEGYIAIPIIQKGAGVTEMQLERKNVFFLFD